MINRTDYEENEYTTSFAEKDSVKLVNTRHF